MENAIDSEIKISRRPDAATMLIHSAQLWDKAKEKVPAEYVAADQNVSFLLYSPAGEALAGVYGRMQFRVFHMDVFWVGKGARGRGYGKKITDAVVEYCRRHQCSHIFGYTYDFYDFINVQQGFGVKLLAQLENAPPPFTLSVFCKEL